MACAMGGASSPLGEALARHGLAADDIALVYKHDTSTGANDPNENALHERIQTALGRTEGNPLYIVSQKALTGHSKGGAAAWQTIGLCQALVSGIVPGNRNLDCVDSAMRSYGHLAFTDTPIHTAPGALRAGLATSLGFGHVSVLTMVLHPETFEALVPASELEQWRARVADRARWADAQRAAILVGERVAFEKRTDRRFVAADGTAEQADEEAALLLDPDALLSLETGRFTGEVMS